MTASLNNGVFLRESTIVANSHLDSYHLRNMLGEQSPDNMGLIELWAMKQKANIPLYSLASLNTTAADLVQNPDGIFKWQIPVQNDLPFVVEDLDSTNITKGIDGQPFQVKFSRREFGKTDIITYDKYQGVELYVIPERDIIDAGDHAIYWVQLVNNDNAQYLDNQFLKSGTKYFRKGSARGEFSQEFADMRVQRGYREFINLLPTGSANYTYDVSSRAALMLKGGINHDGRIPVTELWTVDKTQVDPSVDSVESLTKAMGGAKGMAKGVQEGKIGYSFITKMEAAGVSKIGLDIENYLMWGQGGRVRGDGPDDIRMTVGLWKQLDSAYKFIYNKGTFSLDIFRAQLYNFYNGKEPTQPPMPTRILEVWTGMAGSLMINNLIGAEAKALGWIVNADKSGLGAITGTGMNLGFGYYFTEIIIPHFAVLRFKINPAFDPNEMNTIENPLVDGFPLSSYSFIIHDINDSKDNIKLKKYAWDPGFRMWYQNYTMDYMGKTSGFQSSGRQSGFAVFMEQMYPMIFVVDPTKLLKIVMRNPVTGSSL